MKSCQTLFLSDLHLGASWCRADVLYETLKTVEFDELYLVGDVLDAWHIRHEKMSEDHLNVLKLLHKISLEKNVFYLTGNHDKFLNKGESFNPHLEKYLEAMIICQECIYEACDGRRYLVTHGDKYDFMLKIPFVERFGTESYCHMRSGVRKIFSFVKKRTSKKKVVSGKNMASSSSGQSSSANSGTSSDANSDANSDTSSPIQSLAYSSTFENAIYSMGINCHKLLVFVCGSSKRVMRKATKKVNMDGVICGHTHMPDLCELKEQLVYANCGSWVAAATYILASADGTLSLFSYARSSELSLLSLSPASKNFL